MDVWQTCFLVPGLTRGECAGWVQAWGSIAAILVAVAVGRHQSRRSSELAQQAIRHSESMFDLERQARVLAVGALLEEAARVCRSLLSVERPEDIHVSGDIDVWLDCHQRLVSIDPLQIPVPQLVGYLVTLPRRLQRAHGAIANFRRHADEVKDDEIWNNPNVDRAMYGLGAEDKRYILAEISEHEVREVLEHLHFGAKICQSSAAGLPIS